MSLPPHATLQFTPDLRICRILNGMWQVSGGHGRIDLKAAVLNMFDYHDQGFTTWDLADISLDFGRTAGSHRIIRDPLANDRVGADQAVLPYDDAR